VSLKAEEIATSFKQRGGRVAFLSLISAIAFGVIDQFSSKTVPSLVDKIENYFDPPKFFIIFSPPVDISGGFGVSTPSRGADAGRASRDVHQLGDLGRRGGL
jgi:hypothetical protein